VTEFDIPNPNNFCGGNFQDWLEVYLTSKCNGKCLWCIDKKGFHPKEHVSVNVLVKKIVESGKKNIILLGGEPTLYPNLQELIRKLNIEHKNVYLTTNGSNLDKRFVDLNLIGLTGLNISIHDYNLRYNYFITGIYINNLEEKLKNIQLSGIEVRLNCNCIKGYIDNKDKVLEYIEFAKNMGVHKVRFAELKDSDEEFVNLVKMFTYNYGLNEDPYKLGCNHNTVINGVNVNFRLMCGFQTNFRPKPKNPKQIGKNVLYYNGIIYDGWQMKPKNKQKETKMTDKELIRLLNDVYDNETTTQEAFYKIKKALEKLETENKDLKTYSYNNCRY